eukprot:CAMPEP_0171311314 /NCGR_PEP_ID=MMETSP0816-20121228/21551_1 /TAXON_ID=420281 /ORGANISM="Proboscia inermis, Strain CCAP1064/1" /LENGTH=204 /DNA_ID=CAMNT_0011796011 /DNA_START=99 /DNA_END=713 /DNA_ORIENTATION=+
MNFFPFYNDDDGFCFPFIDYVYPLFLSIGSSTDNFTVGASLGLSSKPLEFHANLIISIANAAGAFISCAGGQILEQALFQGIAPILAGLAFLYLAYDEFTTPPPKKQGPEVNNTLDNTSCVNIMKLAIPMTLNNLAGGVAGGAAGVKPILSGVMAFIASFAMMKLGYKLGIHLGPTLREKVDTHFISSCIFGSLALFSFAGFTA